MRNAGVVLVAALALGIVGLASGQARVGSEDLLERLDGAREVCEEGMSDPSEERMELVRRTLGLPVVVELDGWTASLPVDHVIDGLDGDAAADFRRALARIIVLRESVAAAIRAEPLHSDRVEADLEDAYRGVVEVRPGLIERLRRASAELLQGLAYRLFTFVGTGTTVAWVVVVALGIAALWLLRRLKLVPDRALPAARSSSARERPDWRRRAEEAIQAGDLREAMRALYRGLLGTLVAHGYPVEGPGVTAAECRAAVSAGPPALSSAVEEATESFERVIYGSRSAEPRDVSLLQRAEALARSG